MKLVIQGKNIEVTDAIRDYVTQKIEKAVTHFHHLFNDVNIDLSVEKNPRVSPSKQMAEVTIYVNDSIVRAQEGSDNLYVSIDLVADKISRQLRKYKERRQASTREPIKTAVALQDQPIVNLHLSDREPELPPEVVRMKYFAMPAMSLEDARSQLQLVDHDFYMFRNSETDEINVIYERNHGGFGLIQPRKTNGHTSSSDIRTLLGNEGNESPQLMAQYKELAVAGKVHPAEMAHALGAMDL